MNGNGNTRLPRMLAFVVAWAFAVVGATAVAISGMASDGYYIIVTGPVYLAISGSALLVAAAHALRFVPSARVKWLSVIGCGLAALLFASWAGVTLGSFINHSLLHWPVSDHRLP